MSSFQQYSCREAPLYIETREKGWSEIDRTTRIPTHCLVLQYKYCVIGVVTDTIIIATLDWRLHPVHMRT